MRSVFLPISIPMVVTARTVAVRGMVVLLLVTSRPRTMSAFGAGARPVDPIRIGQGTKIANVTVAANPDRGTIRELAAATLSSHS